MKKIRFWINCSKIYLRVIYFEWIKLLFSILCTAVTLISITTFIKDIEQPSFTFLEIILLCLTALVFSALIVLPSILKKYNIKGQEGVQIQLMYGDILDSRFNIVIPTNTSFDTDRTCIKSNSIQGQFCDRFYCGRSIELNEKLIHFINENNIEGAQAPNKKVGNKIRYPINSIVHLATGSSADDQIFYWIAINNHDDYGNVPTENICITESIQALWEHLEKQRKVQSLAIPILGTGLTGINQPTFDVLEYIVDSFIQITSRHKIADVLRIYIYPKNHISFQDFELADRYLKFRCENPLTIKTKNIF